MRFLIHFRPMILFPFIIQTMWMRKYSSKLTHKKFWHHCFLKCHVTNLTISVIDYLQQLLYIGDGFLEETSIKSNIYKKKWCNSIWNISCKITFRKLRSHDKNRKEKYGTFLRTLFVFFLPIQLLMIIHVWKKTQTRNYYFETSHW